MLSGFVIAAGTVVVIAVEKLPLVEHYAMRVRIIDGVVFGLPFLVLAWLLARRANRPAVAASTPQRPVPFGGRR